MDFDLGLFWDRNKSKVPVPKTVSDIQLHHGKTRQDLFSWMENITDPVKLLILDTYSLLYLFYSKHLIAFGFLYKIRK